MITKDNFKELILKPGFSAEGDKFLKKFKAVIKSYLMGKAEEPDLAMAAEPEKQKF